MKRTSVLLYASLVDIKGVGMPDPNVLWSGAMGSLLAAIIALVVVKLTNGNQARLAVEAREKAAISDLVACAGRLTTEHASGKEAIATLLHGMSAASVRWRMEMNHPAMDAEIEEWPSHLTILALQALNWGEGAHASLKRGDLVVAEGKLRDVALGWHRGSKADRDRYVTEMRELRVSQE